MQIPLKIKKLCKKLKIKLTTRRKNKRIPKKLKQLKREIRNKTKKGSRFIQRAFQRAKKKGTVGSFRRWCKSKGLLISGKVSQKCVNLGKRSKNALIRKRAVFAQNIKGYKNSRSRFGMDTDFSVNEMYLSQAQRENILMLYPGQLYASLFGNYTPDQLAFVIPGVSDDFEYQVIVENDKDVKQPIIKVVYNDKKYKLNVQKESNNPSFYITIYGNGKLNRVYGSIQTRSVTFNELMDTVKVKTKRVDKTYKPVPSRRNYMEL